MQADTEVNWEDQQNINNFGKLNTEMHELEEDLKKKEVELEDLKEAESEVMLSEDDSVRLLVGEVFVQVPISKATDIIEEKNIALEEEINQIVKRIDEIKKQLEVLKVKLYAKFKDQINLEE